MENNAEKLHYLPSVALLTRWLEQIKVCKRVGDATLLTRGGDEIRHRFNLIQNLASISGTYPIEVIGVSTVREAYERCLQHNQKSRGMRSAYRGCLLAR